MMKVGRWGESGDGRAEKSKWSGRREMSMDMDVEGGTTENGKPESKSMKVKTNGRKLSFPNGKSAGVRPITTFLSEWEQFW